MEITSSFRVLILGVFGMVACCFFAVNPVQAAVCSVTDDTIIDQAFVDGGSCTAINIEGTDGNVSTTWIGSVDLGGGTVTVKTGNIMTLGTSSTIQLGVADDLVVETGASITHTGQDQIGIQISARNATIAAGGTIDASGLGCAGGDAGLGHAYGPNLTTGVCTISTSGYGRGGGGGGAPGGGGSYGGTGGGDAGAGYGTSTLPVWLGSGGGSGYFTVGGNGGGRVALTISGVLTLNGVIAADGTDGGNGGSYGGGGGGSGGSIFISTATLAGSGTIHANGGSGNLNAGGGGGGGRVAVYYATRSGFALTSITATKGAGGSSDTYSGKNGSTFLLDRLVDDGAGNLYISSGLDFYEGGDFTRTSLTIAPQASLSCATGLTSLYIQTTSTLDQVTFSCSRSLSSFELHSPQNLTLINSTLNIAGSISTVILSADADLVTSSTSLSFTQTSNLTLTADAWLNATTTIALTKAGSQSSWNLSEDLQLRNFTYTGATPGTVTQNGGVLSIPGEIALAMVNSTIASNVSSTRLTSFNMDAGSVIDASGFGCMGGTGLADGYGPSLTTGICTISTAGFGTAGGGGGGVGGGAAHGGIGGGSSHSLVTYGSSTYPTLFGSGGGSGYFTDGGSGGGKITISVAGALQIDGTIAADGTNGGDGGSYGGGGGGSGGSIFLSAGTFGGAGAIRTNGGAGGHNSAGGGGGGRVALVYTGFSFSGTSSTNGGTNEFGAASGASGSLFTLHYIVPVTPSLTAPISGIYNASRNPLAMASAYADGSIGLTHLSTDWKVTSDSLGTATVWSSLADTDDLTSITVNAAKGSFSGTLLGQTALAASSTYYAFTRYTNRVGSSDWSVPSVFTTPYLGTSSTLTLAFDDVTPASVFDYDPATIEVNASGNGYARLIDLGSSDYSIAGSFVGWSKRKTVTITNPNASILTSFQVKVPVTYDADMQADFDDLRFTADDGTTNLAYWLESKTDGVSATFWVKVPSLPASGTSTLQMYYGNGSAVSLSNGTSTFEFFDDFNDGEANNWGTYAVHAAAPATSTSDGTLVVSGASTEGGVFTRDYTLGDGVVEADVILDQRTGPGQDFYIAARGDGSMSNFYRFGPYWAGSNEAGIALEGGHNRLAFASYDYGNDIWRKMSFSLHGTSLAGSFDGTELVSATNGSYSSGYIGFGLDAYHENATFMQVRIDNVRVRQFAAADPSPAFGTEESMATFSSIALATTSAGSQAAYAQLYRFEENAMPGSTGSVKYQLSNNGTTWKYWNGSSWATASDTLDQTNSSSTINGYLPLFASQVGAGDLYVRTLLVSNGSQPVGLDGLSFFYQLSNQSPSTPTSLAPTALTNGSTTGTTTPTVTFDLADPDGADTVKYRVQIDNTADFSSPVVDYTSALAAQGARSFQVGQATAGGAYSVGSVSQTLADGSYYWRVRTIDAASAVSAYATSNAGEVAFIVDTGTRTIQFAQAGESETESLTATSVRILLNTAHFEDVTVEYAVTGGSAQGSGEDFLLSSGMATISAGETSTTIPLTIIDDSDVESNETIIITLSHPNQASLGSDSTFTYTIIDNDVAPITNAGGGAVGAGVGIPIPVLIPLFPLNAPVSESDPSIPAVSVSPSVPSLPVQVPREPSVRVLNFIKQDLRQFSVGIPADLRDQALFIEFGSTPLTIALGEGERRAIFRDLLDILRKMPTLVDQERVATGQIPLMRNLTQERRLAPRALQTFKTIFGHAPVFSNAKENLAWNTMLYRLRFPRELGKEKEGIIQFKKRFKQEPKDAFQWAVVRVLGYVK